MAVELISRPPFIRVMPSMSFPLNERLISTVYFGLSGRPKRFLVAKSHGRAGTLKHSDTLREIYVPAPDESFRRILSPQPYTVRETLGRYRWNWTQDGAMLFAWDDMEFYFTSAEAKLLDGLFFNKPDLAEESSEGL